MVSYLWQLLMVKLQDSSVLILVVVEDGLVLNKIALKKFVIIVLILVVVEDGLVPILPSAKLRWAQVLILVVVEDGLVLGLIRHY